MKLLEEKIEEMQREGQVFTLELADLVMMQMIGDFDAFLDRLARGNGGVELAQTQIEETRGLITGRNQRLYPEIVNKTITAQFGDKYATVRELGQNAVDAYSQQERMRAVEFEFIEGESDHYGKGWDVLRVRDYGCGMNLRGLIRNLLVPYNSAKEGDPTKIGEHGIGWYSIVDVAHLVRVVSKPWSLGAAAQALVYQQGDKWLTTVLPSSQNGFARHSHRGGTQVDAFIQKGVISREGVRKHLFQYLGMLSDDAGTIFLDSEIINSMRVFYDTANPATVTIDGRVAPLTMGVSKRAVRQLRNDDRFALRDKQLDKIIFTQRGLFVHYENAKFDERSMHARLLSDLLRMGMDFWVEYPQHATLTKGRNNIIGDHRVAVLQGMYEAFENLFIDVILSDDDILYHPEGHLLSSIANLFDVNYRAVIEGRERNRYHLRIKALNYTARAADVLVYGIETGAKGLDIGARWATKESKRAAIAIGRRIGTAALYPFTTMPGQLEGLAEHCIKRMPEWRKNLPVLAKDLLHAVATNSGSISLNVAKYGGIAAGAVLGVAGVAYGGYHASIYAWEWLRYFGWTPWQYVVYGVGAAVALTGALGVAYACYKGARTLPQALSTLAPSLSELVRDIRFKRRRYATDEDDMPVRDEENPSERNLEDHRSRGERRRYNVSRGLAALAHSAGLYVNVEEKRERKRLKQRGKIARKYLSGMEENQFFKRILQKEIIEATHYRSPHTIQQEVEHIPTMRELFQELWTGRPLERQRQRRWWKSSCPPDKLLQDRVKLSIDAFIDLYLRGKAMVAGRERRQLQHDDYVVKSNPLIGTITDKLEGIRHKVREDYNVKVLEDRIDHIITFGKRTAVFLYMLTPVGFVHALYSDATGKKDSALSGTRGSQAVINTSRRLRKAIPGVLQRLNPVPYAQNVYTIMLTDIKKIPHAMTYVPGIAGNCAIGAGYAVVLPVYYLGLAIGKIGIAMGQGTYSLGRLGLRRGVQAGIGLYHAACDIYHERIIPLGQALHPKRYPGYWQDLETRVERLREDRKVTRELKRQERHLDERIEVQGLNTAAKDKCKKTRILKPLLLSPFHAGASVYRRTAHVATRTYHWYTTTSLFDLLGYGEREVDACRGLSLQKLEKLTDSVGAGQAYVSYLRAVHSLEEHVARALGVTPYGIIFEDDWEISNPDNGWGYVAAKRKEKPRFTINLARSTNQDFVRSMRIPIDEKGNIKRERFDFTDRWIADEIQLCAYAAFHNLIHLHTHLDNNLPHQEKNPQNPYSDHSYHDRVFLNQLLQNVNRVIQYFMEHNLDPLKLYEEHVRMLPSLEYVADVPNAAEVKRWMGFTRRRLHAEKLHYEKVRAGKVEPKNAPVSLNATPVITTVVSNNAPDQFYDPDSAPRV